MPPRRFASSKSSKKSKKVSSKQWFFDKETEPAHDELAKVPDRTPMSSRNVPSERDVTRARQRAQMSRKASAVSDATRQFQVAKRDRAKLSAFSLLTSALAKRAKHAVDVEEENEDDDDDDNDDDDDEQEEEEEEADDDDADDDADVIHQQPVHHQMADRVYEEEASDDTADDADDDDDDDDDDAIGEVARVPTVDAYEAHFLVGDVEEPSEPVVQRFYSVASESASQIEFSRQGASFAPLPPDSSFADLSLHRRVSALLASEAPSPTQIEFAQLIGDYRDVFYAQRSAATAKQLRTVYCAHAISHVLKARDVQIRNSKRLAHDETLELRDSGFARPRVLFVAPHRRQAFEIALELARLFPGQKVINQGRLEDEFGDDTVSADDDDELARGRAPKKPADHRETFRGNNDDSFRFGVGLTAKGIKFFTEFYQSDFIIASPLGMRLLFEQREVERLAGRKTSGAAADADQSKPAASVNPFKKADTDFLSSIQVCVVEHADVLLMQNWDHTVRLLSRLNRLPHETRDTDFSRVHLWCLEGHARLLRQTIVLSSVVEPLLNAALKRHCANLAGAWRVRARCTGGAVRGVMPRVRQLLHRVDAPPDADLAALAKARLEYFRDTLLPSLTVDGGRGGVLIYFASYFDYVRVRNLYKLRRLSYLQCCEYTDEGNVTRSRFQFAQGNVEFFLYTERFHFYHRYHIRGTRSIVFYGLPTFPAFYTELLNWLADGATVVVLYTVADRLALERCVGVERTKTIFASLKTVHMLV
jgi:U3 small nucleolar RNA-associated protein 25